MLVTQRGARTARSSTVPLDLGAFDAPRRAIPPERLPDELRRPLRTWRIALVVSLVVGLVGVALLVLGLQDWNRLTSLLVAIGALAPCMLLLPKPVGPTTAARIRRFAADNGFELDVLEDSPGYAGSAFTLGHSQRRLMVVRGSIRDHRVEVGNLSYRVGPRASPGQPGYVAIRLPTRLPHVVMSSRPALLMRVGIVPRAEDRIDLGGGRLRVSTPAETKDVVRTMLTPQAVGTLSRLSERYCIEILDGVLSLHSRRSLSTGSARRWRATIDAVAEVCDLLDASPIWSAMQRRPKRAPMPRLRSGIDERRITRRLLLGFAALMIVVTVVVAWLHDW